MTNTLQQAKDRIRSKYHGATIETGNEPDDLVLLNEVERLGNINDVLAEACRAQRAWFIAEHQSIGSYDDRMDLCSWTEYLMNKALSAATGECDDPGEFEGHLRIGVQPGFVAGSARAEVQVMRQLVDAILDGQTDITLQMCVLNAEGSSHDG